MEDLEKQKAEITARLELAPTDVPDLHPNIATLYGKRVEQLTQALAHHEDGRPAAEALRSLIGQIVLTPGEKRGEVHAELRGELFGILELAKPDPNDQSDEVMTKGVAGPRNQPTCILSFSGRRGLARGGPSIQILATRGPPDHTRSHEGYTGPTISRQLRRLRPLI
ncbi:hypothetical protein [Mesorhizobium sp. LCM 4577]|uniref:hypothetical protein n=1 Tax=Mesorhizobium sp. LCM 4577 TaxID=1848288 RepID=UPI0018E31FF1|nr:hypothetical protein [Mesorhizobium sp. LCM 4577]